ncbi:MAG: DUF2849 domain-containing protein [Pseudomonadota bacterium]
MTLKILTANHLQNGHVVFLGEDGAWSPRLAAARLARDGEEAAALEAEGEAAQAARRVVGPYLIEVEATAEGPLPLRGRERIRVAGPTVRRDLGPWTKAE